MPPEPHRPKLVVIHGHGATFAESARTLEEFSRLQATWIDGSYCLAAPMVGVVRHLLTSPAELPLLHSLQKLVVGRLLLGSAAQPPAPAPLGATALVPDFLVTGNFSRLGLPLSPGARLRRAAQIVAEAEEELASLSAMVREALPRLNAADARMPSEEQAREILQGVAAQFGRAEDLMEAIELFRGMHERGGDLDTVCSAVFYAYWLSARPHPPVAEPAVHGRDYRFVFVNYHEGLRHLAAYGPADILMADVPTGALPDLPGDARFLREHGLIIERYEDHHPCPDATLTMLQSLQKDRLLTFFEMSGPRDDAELPHDQLRCGADMVFDNLIAGKPWDCEGARQLRAVTHAEDFASGRTELSRLLTELIKAGVCKVELAQLLAAGIPGNDITERLQNRGWDQLGANWRAELDKFGPAVRESLYTIRLRRVANHGAAPPAPIDAVAHDGAVGTPPGSDGDAVMIAISLAPGAEPGTPRVNVGKATEIVAAAVPEAAYLLYAYGERLLVGRRLDPDDATLNLGSLMPQIGSQGDGGHAGAAVCRPDSNPAYPRRILGHVSAGNFAGFVRYLGSRLAALGFRVEAISNHSVPAKQTLHQGGRRLLLVVAATIVIGLLLIALFPAFRPARIRATNADLYPYLADPVPAAPDRADAEGQPR